MDVISWIFPISYDDIGNVMFYEGANLGRVAGALCPVERCCNQGNAEEFSRKHNNNLAESNVNYVSLSTNTIDGEPQLSSNTWMLHNDYSFIGFCKVLRPEDDVI